MKNYISGYKDNSSSRFAARFAQLQKSEEVARIINEKEEFDNGYKKGSLRYAIASKFLKLASHGLNSYTEDGLNIIWVREGDSICRVENDLSWVDEILNKEDKNETR